MDIVEQTPQKKKKKKGCLIAFLIVLLVFALILVVPAAILLGYINAKMNLIERSDGIRSEEGIVDASAATVQAEDLMLDLYINDLEQREMLPASGEIRKEKGVSNILFIFTDDEGEGFSEESYVEALLLVSFNTKEKKLSSVTLNTAIGVTVLEGSHAGEFDRLSATYRYGGEALLIKQVSDAFKVQVDYFVRLNHNTMISALNMTGADGETLVREAMSEVTADRNDRALDLMSQVVSEIFKQSPDTWDDSLEAILPRVRTNMKNSQIVSLITALPGIATEGTFGSAKFPLTGNYGWMEGVEGRKMFALDMEVHAKELQALLYGSK